MRKKGTLIVRIIFRILGSSYPSPTPPSEKQYEKFFLYIYVPCIAGCSGTAIGYRAARFFLSRSLSSTVILCFFCHTF